MRKSMIPMLAAAASLAFTDAGGRNPPARRNAAPG
jgi:hypothetical protein